MAETITYDPSNDPEAIAEAEARDGETLAVGEKMIEEQSELLAGKYKDAEALEKAYIELQQKLGDQESKPEQALPSDKWEASPGVSGYDTEGAVDYDAVEKVYGEQLSSVFEKADLDPWTISKHFHENEGTITDDMYSDLENAGIPRSTIDSYLAGRANEMGYTSSDDSVDQAYVDDMYKMAGGKRAYNNMTDWARDNLNEDDQQAFNDVTSSGNKAAVRFAVKALMGQYEDAVGRQPTLVTGKNARSPGTYRSMAEVVRDMEDSRYEKDEAFRFDVMQKLERSNLKV